MTESAIGVHASAVGAVAQAVAVIDATEFAAFGGGWPGEIGTALVDAVSPSGRPTTRKTPNMASFIGCRC